MSFFYPDRQQTNPSDANIKDCLIINKQDGSIHKADQCVLVIIDELSEEDSDAIEDGVTADIITVAEEHGRPIDDLTRGRRQWSC